MDMKEAILRRRTIRRYKDRPVDHALLQELLSVVPYYLSPANLQPLKFLAVSDRVICDQLFPTLKWAAYLPEYTVSEQQAPKAYIVVLGDRSICRDFQFSAGSAVTCLSLFAMELGLDTCCLGSIDRKVLYPLLGVEEDQLEILYVLAIGYGAHKARAVPMAESHRYYLEEQENFVVPKRRLEDIVRFDRWNNP